jgi:mitochondrial import inner membrane translocase subunit TIM50
LTYLEQKRKEAQFHYKEDMAFIEEHKADFERLLEEDRQAMEKEMSGTLWGALDALTNGPSAKKDKKASAEQGVVSSASGSDSSLDSSGPPSPLGKA